jgi:hypothetical protein
MKGRKKWSKKRTATKEPDRTDSYQNDGQNDSNRPMDKRRRISTESVRSRLGEKPAGSALGGTASSANVFNRLGKSKVSLGAFTKNPVTEPFHKAAKEDCGNGMPKTLTSDDPPLTDGSQVRKPFRNRPRAGARPDLYGRSVDGSGLASNHRMGPERSGSPRDVAREEESQQTPSGSRTALHGGLDEHSLSDSRNGNGKHENNCGASESLGAHFGSPNRPLAFDGTNTVATGSALACTTSGGDFVRDNVVVATQRVPDTDVSRDIVGHYNNGSNSSPNTSSNVSPITSPERSFSGDDARSGREERGLPLMNALPFRFDGENSYLRPPSNGSDHAHEGNGDRLHVFFPHENSPNSTNPTLPDSGLDDAEQQQKRNALAWDGLLAKYPASFTRFERGLRIIVRSYLDSSNVVKPLPIPDVERELEAAAARWRRCRDEFPFCSDPQLFEDFVIGTESSFQKIERRISGHDGKVMSDRTNEDSRWPRECESWSQERKTAALLRSCVRLSDGAALDSDLVGNILASDDIDAAITENFNRLFGVESRFQMAPGSPWISNYRSLRDAYGFASRFRCVYFSVSGVVSCVLDGVTENEMILAHDRCARAFPEPASCPVVLNHASWTRLSSIEFARRVFRSVSAEALSKGLNLTEILPSSLIEELSNEGITLDRLRQASSVVVARSTPLRCWTEAAAISVLVSQYDTPDALKNRVEDVEIRCLKYSPPKRFCVGSEWAGLSEIDFATKLFASMSTSELSKFFGLPVSGTVHARMKSKPVPIGELATFLARTTQETIAEECKICGQDISIGRGGFDCCEECVQVPVNAAVISGTRPGKISIKGRLGRGSKQLVTPNS